MSYRYVVFRFIVPLLTRWAAPAFMMISGFLLLNPEREFSLARARRGVFRMLRILLIFGLAYCLMEEFFTSGMGAPLQSIAAAFRKLLCGQSWDHMWYIYMMVGLYAITPLLRVFTAHADRRTLHYAFGLLFFFAILLPTLKDMLNLPVTDFYLNIPAFVFYYYSGYYLTKVKPGKRLCRAVLAAGVLCFLLADYLLSYWNINPEALFVCLIALPVFRLCAQSAVMERLAGNRFIQLVSRHSLMIYLIHPLWLNLLRKVCNVHLVDFTPLAGCLLMMAAAFAGALLCSWILSKIPLLKKL